MSQKKKLACLGMPSYGELTAAAARGFYRPSRGMVNVEQKQAPHPLLRHPLLRGCELDVSLLCHQSSLLAANMNALWCWALNKAHKAEKGNGEPVAYFAMQHADIEPEEWWIDKLIAELEAQELDVLGVVAPIKDQRGITSIAMARADGDPWRVHGRLTMTEVFKLPPTFRSADLGFDLLLNTGLWVCKWNMDWAKKVHFTVNDRICFDPKRGVYFAQVEPEDWFVSRLFHELGLKIGCTRKIELGHRGPMNFGNTEPWGKETFDREYLEQSVLDSRPPCDWFPHDAAGWLTEDEGRELARLAEGKVVLEIGSFCGRSTICLAQKARNVAAVDTFDGRGTATPGATLETFKRNLRRYGVEKKVSIIRGKSADQVPNLPPIFELAFVDGAHDRESVLEDAALAAGALRAGGILAFHDYQTAENAEVTVAVDELLARGWKMLGRCGSLAVIDPVVAPAPAHEQLIAA